MELNRTHLLVHDNWALEKFRATTHGIPAKCYNQASRAQRYSPHSDGEIRLHLVSYLANPPGRAPISNQPDAKGVVRPNKETSNPFYSVNHYLRLRDPSQPKTRDDGLWSFPRRNRSLPSSEYFFRSSPCSPCFMNLPCIGIDIAPVACTKFNDRFKVRSDACKEAIPTANNMQESREAFGPEGSGREEGDTARSSGHNSPNPIDNGEKEEEASSQLVLNKSESRVVPMLYLEGTSSPISVLSSDSEHFDDLARVLHLSTRGTEVIGTSSSKANIIRFRNLRKAGPTATPSTEVVLPAIPAPHQIVGLSVEVAMAVTGADPGSLGASIPWKLMLSSDSTALVKEFWDTIKNLLSLQRGMATSDQMAEYSAELKQGQKENGDLACGSTFVVSVSEWLIQPCPYGVAGSLSSTADISIWASRLSKGPMSCKSPSVPCHLLGLSPVVAPRLSFQHNYCPKLTKQRHLGGNDGLGSGGHSSIMVTTLSSSTEGLRTRSVATVGRDLCPSKVSVELRRRGPPSSLCSGSSSGVPTL
ncbi:hypothetical protein Acr_00g0095290 [Actinidia rufa]|uniref:Uncharacterized protein n=1 Tax=Actinidia rufa TaxID=165716 RepID=A0A7J0DYD0_9ERIC|nr:hypothetical protein Acr_00g0095290 [Actinidia rufa]